MPRTTEPQISFADWELMQQEIVLDPLPAAISDLREQHQELIRVDPSRSRARPETVQDGPRRLDASIGPTLAFSFTNDALDRLPAL